MNAINIIDTLVNWLKIEFAGYELPASDGTMKTVNVFPQFLPQPDGISYSERASSGLAGYKPNDYADTFPCIIVKITGITDAEENSTSQSSVNVVIICGVYDEAKDCQGYRYILAMQEKIRLLLLEHRVLDNRYLLQMPMKSRLLEPENWPVWYGQQDLVYLAGRPLQNWDYIHGGRRPHTAS